MVFLRTQRKNSLCCYRYMHTCLFKVVVYNVKTGFLSCQVVEPILLTYSKQMGAVLKELQEDADVLKAWCQNLIRLQKVLRPQAKAFYEKHFQVC